MKRYQYILFDWDGTLAKTLDIWLMALRVALEKRGHNLSDKEIGADYELFKQYFETQGHADSNLIIGEATALADTKIPSVQLYPYALDALSQLKSRGKKLALVTTSRHAQIDPLLETYALGDLFDVVICGEDTERLKPDAQPIMKAIRELQANSEDVLLVGDSKNDLMAATNAGIDSMLFYPPSHEVFHNLQSLRQLNPTHIVHDLREISLLV